MPISLGWRECADHSTRRGRVRRQSSEASVVQDRILKRRKVHSKTTLEMRVLSNIQLSPDDSTHT